MKKKLISIIIFLFVLVFPVVAWPLLVHLDNTNINENRKPAPFPEFSNEFVSDFDKFLTDHAPLRNSLIKMYSGFESWTNKIYEDMLNAIGIPYYSSKNNALFGKEDWLFYLGDKSLDYYQGKNIPSEQELAIFVEKAEKINNYFISKGKQFKIFIAPNKEQVYSEFLPNGIYVFNQQKRIDVIVDYFKAHSNVEIIYPKQELLDAKEMGQIYYKYDTHWNSAGGYFGTLPLLQALNIEIGEVKLEESSRMGGDLLNMIAVEPKEDVEFKVDYRPEISFQINFENDTYRCTSDNPNGKNLFLIGDSFREKMINTLGKEFTNSAFGTRLSYTNTNFYEEEFEQADTVVFQCVERYEQHMFTSELFDKFITQYSL